MEELTGLSSSHVSVTGDGLNTLIKSYCRESGVRNLRKQIEKIYRKAAYQVTAIFVCRDIKIVVHAEKLLTICTVVSYNVENSVDNLLEDVKLFLSYGNVNIL